MSGNILLVEDDNELRNIWEMYLKPYGFEVHHAQNGVEALHLAQANPPDLVVLDLMMPMASGDLVLGFIRSTDELKDVLVLVVSAHQNIASLAQQYEADGYLKKPVSIDEFREAVLTLMSSLEG